MPNPNILMITCHDIGQHLRCYGIYIVQTPNLDWLASQGVRFHNHHATSSVCSPARGSLHTGRYPQSNGLLGLTHAPWWWNLNPAERHTAEILKENERNQVIGSCGYANLNKYDRSASAGYDLHPLYWNQGIMTEALTEIIHFGFSSGFFFPLNRIEALTYVEHDVSVRLLNKLGFQEEGIRREYGYFKGEFHDLRSFSLLRRDWKVR